MIFLDYSLYFMISDNQKNLIYLKILNVYDFELLNNNYVAKDKMKI